MVLPFPPLVAVALGALGAALVVRHVVKDWGRRKADVKSEDAAIEASKREAIPKLRRDPETGIYRP